MAAMLLGRDVEHLAPTGSGKTLVFEMDSPCYTCDRCCGKGGGTDEGLACEATAFAESRRDLHGASARLWSRL
eukprot:scaffold75674_cov36-Phaeocystis_antarctica.AAC.1